MPKERLDSTIQIDVITRTRDEARATLRMIARQISDPCLGCDYQDLCEGGYLCPMLRLDLYPRSEDCQDARDLAEFMATARA